MKVNFEKKLQEEFKYEFNVLKEYLTEFEGKNIDEKRELMRTLIDDKAPLIKDVISGVAQKENTVNLAKIANEIKSRGIAKQVQKLFSFLSYNSGTEDAGTCVFCETNEGQLRSMHLFCGVCKPGDDKYVHVHCLCKWLIRHPTCPYCRSLIEFENPKESNTEEEPIVNYFNIIMSCLIAFLNVILVPVPPKIERVTILGTYLVDNGRDEMLKNMQIALLIQLVAFNSYVSGKRILKKNHYNSIEKLARSYGVNGEEMLELLKSVRSRGDEMLDME